MAPFNNLPAIERLFAAHPGEIAAIIIEPIMMNIAFCMPDEGYIHRLLETAHKHGALLIMDEVKTGAKLAWGGACEYFNVKPDIICLGKSIGGGFPLAAFAASQRGNGTALPQHKVFHARSYATNPPGDGGRYRYAARSAYSRRLYPHRRLNRYVGRLSGDIVKHGLGRTSTAQARTARCFSTRRESATIATGITWRRSVDALLVRHVEPRRAGAALLVGRTMDHFRHTP